jgi:hypothetical protein
VLLAAGFLVAGYFPAAAAAAAVAAIAGCLALFIKYESTGRKGVPLTFGRRLGEAPYVEVKCHADQNTIVSLIRSIKGLVNHPIYYADEDDEEEELEIDKSRLNACLDEAESKARKNEFADALRLGWVATKVLLGK